MTTNRIYKTRKTNTEAIELNRHKGKQFDPDIVDAAIEFFKTFLTMLSHINQLPQSFIKKNASFYKR